MKYKNLVLDVGEVLLSYRWREMMEDYGLSKDEADRFYYMMFGDPMWVELDLENIPFDEVMGMFIEKNPSHEDEIRYFFSHKELMPVARDAIYREVERLLDGGMRAYILSNYPSTFFTEHTKRIPFMDRLSGMIVSSGVHLMKPDRRIYEALFHTYGILPEESIFFDDRKVNVDASVALGMDAVQVTTEEMLIRELQKLQESVS